MFSYLKNKQTTAATTLTTPAPIVAQQLNNPKPMKSYASASHPHQAPLSQSPATKFDLFDDDSFHKILKPASPTMSPWNKDSFSKGPNVPSQTNNSSYMDSNYNHVAQQSNKTSNGQQGNNCGAVIRIINL